MATAATKPTTTTTTPSTTTTTTTPTTKHTMKQTIRIPATRIGPIITTT